MAELRNFTDNSTTDNLGYDLEQYEGIDLPALENFYGPVSESLVIACAAQKSIIIEGLDVAGRKRQIELKMDVTQRFINGELLLFGAPTGRRFCVAFKTKGGGWYYPGKFVRKLEEIDTEDHWLVKIHLYHRV